MHFVHTCLADQAFTICPPLFLFHKFVVWPCTIDFRVARAHHKEGTCSFNKQSSIAFSPCHEINWLWPCFSSSSDAEWAYETWRRSGSSSSWGGGWWSQRSYSEHTYEFVARSNEHLGRERLVVLLLWNFDVMPSNLKSSWTKIRLNLGGWHSSRGAWRRRWHEVEKVRPQGSAHTGSALLVSSANSRSSRLAWQGGAWPRLEDEKREKNGRKKEWGEEEKPFFRNLAFDWNPLWFCSKKWAIILKLFFSIHWLKFIAETVTSRFSHWDSKKARKVWTCRIVLDTPLPSGVQFTLSRYRTSLLNRKLTLKRCHGTK